MCAWPGIRQGPAPASRRGGISEGLLSQVRAFACACPGIRQGPCGRRGALGQGAAEPGAGAGLVGLACNTCMASCDGAERAGKCGVAVAILDYGACLHGMHGACHGGAASSLPVPMLLLCAASVAHGSGTGVRSFSLAALTTHPHALQAVANLAGTSSFGLSSTPHSPCPRCCCVLQAVANLAGTSFSDLSSSPHPPCPHCCCVLQAVANLVAANSFDLSPSPHSPCPHCCCVLQAVANLVAANSSDLSSTPHTPHAHAAAACCRRWPTLWRPTPPTCRLLLTLPMPTLLLRAAGGGQPCGRQLL